MTYGYIYLLVVDIHRSDFHQLMLQTPNNVLIAYISCYVVNIDQGIPSYTNIVKKLL